MNSKENSNKPVIKRRKFLFVFGASAIGLAAMAGSPLKLIGSLLNRSKSNAAIAGNSKGKNAGITVKESLNSVKRSQGTREKGSLNG